MENKEFVLNDKKFILVRLQAWNRLMFVADLQKDILTPLLNEMGEKSLDGLFSAASDENSKPDVMKILKSLSSVIDSRNLEKWVKRVLSEGMIVYVKEDEQKVKLSFHEITKTFSAPQDIIMLMKEAIVFNLDGILDIVKGIGTKKN
ncbi:phage tail assembly chaperone [Pantoea anthophila]|uniref:phage tail assembly chaperone n=1 Tax=Pantoea anthophila TaxID=470931 RepID=UPI000614DB05|nr:hypothetical protein [Pantoea anthophila]KKB03457.1 hypothetical protein TN98_16700 [Pantoea anthophila]